MRSWSVLAGALLGLPACAVAAEPIARIVVQHSPLAGLRYYDGNAVWADLRAGDRLLLVREPLNAHDASAIRIEWRGRMLGYVPRRENAMIARFMDLGAAAEARVTELHRHRNGRRGLSYEIVVPLSAMDSVGDRSGRQVK